MRDGRKLSAWYVPSRNGAAVLLSHGSGGSRGRIPAHVRMLARHGYGVLALDNPGNGESDGHSNGLGDNAQPAIAAGLDYLARRPDVDPKRIAGFGLSLGGEVLLDAASHDRRLAAVVSDGATRPMDGDKANPKGAVEGALGWLTMRSVRAISGMKTSPSLLPMMPKIAPRPVLLVAGGGFPDEIPASRLYRDGGRQHRAALGAARHRPHRRPAQAPGGVRAPHGRLPGPRARRGLGARARGAAPRGRGRAAALVARRTRPGRTAGRSSAWTRRPRRARACGAPCPRARARPGARGRPARRGRGRPAPPRARRRARRSRAARRAGPRR